MLGFLALSGGALILAHGFKDPEKQKLAVEGRSSGTVRPAHGEPGKLETIDPTLNPPDPSKPQVPETVPGYMVPFDPPAFVEAAPKPLPPAPKPKEQPKEVLPPISLYAATFDAKPTEEPVSEDYAPFGRLIQCELVITVDSSFIKTPIVGLVTADVWHDGKLIIPAGAEIHGTALVDRERERIASGGEWTLVWQSGEELSVSGIALDREQNPDGEGWGITDGSAGLRGQLIKSDDMAEIKLFAATLLSGAASSLKKTESTIFGTKSVPNLANAPLAGAEDVLGLYAKQILDTIQRDGFYVRVPAGKQFYVYVTETVDRKKARIGGHQIASLQKSEPSTEEVKRAREDQLFLRRARPQSISPIPSAAAMQMQMPLRVSK